MYDHDRAVGVLHPWGEQGMDTAVEIELSIVTGIRLVDKAVLGRTGRKPRLGSAEGLWSPAMGQAVRSADYSMLYFRFPGLGGMDVSESIVSARRES